LPTKSLMPFSQMNSADLKETGAGQSLLNTEYRH
jgi:hypothetical protein